ncbi:MAG TPA: GNAT family N-acetyltransferase, partial [Thermoplasmata archaeon]
GAATGGRRLRDYSPRGAYYGSMDRGPGPPGGGGEQRTVPPVVIRPARLGDVRRVIGLYLGQSELSRSFHHPYPVDRPRLIAIFAWMVVSGHLTRFLLRWSPNLGFALLVACPSDRGVPVAYGTIRFVGGERAGVWARFGFLVAEEWRGRGIGTILAAALWERCIAVGVHRGGGVIQKANLASREIVEKYGFRLEPVEENDQYTPGAETLGGIADLREVLARYRATRPPERPDVPEPRRRG